MAGLILALVDANTRGHDDGICSPNRSRSASMTDHRAMPSPIINETYLRTSSHPK
ncbi:hypothetical protein LXA43DRAFT_1187936 [Ganoderma leucocontextum]|nr:hypothetical protein LXA43DRAFT_1187936 [Ganoderma leucocontextum]